MRMLILIAFIGLTGCSMSKADDSDAIWDGSSAASMSPEFSWTSDVADPKATSWLED